MLVVANGISAAIMISPAPVAAAAVSRSPLWTACPSAGHTYASRVRISSIVENTVVTPNATVNTPMIVIGSM